MEQGLKFKKNFIWNALGTGFNAFNSLFLMILVTRINGVNDAGIYTIAFSTACVVYVIGVYAGRVFQVTERNNQFTDKDFILNRIISVVIMIISTILFVIVRKYDMYKSLVFLLLTVFKALEAFSDVLYGIMQKKDLLDKVGKSYFIKSLLTLIVFGIVDYFTKNIILSCVSIIIVWIVIIAVYDILTVKRIIDIKEKAKWKNSIKIFKTGLYIFLITFMSIYVLNAPKYAIDNMLENSYQTIFGIIVMPSTAICLFGQFLMHPYLNKFVELNEAKKYKEFEKLKYKIIIYMAGFGVISAIGAHIVGIPVLHLIYGLNLEEYKIMLISIIIASTFYNIAMMYSNILTTIRYTSIQFWTYLITSFVALLSSEMLTRIYGIRGATAAYFVIMLVLFFLYALVERIIFNKIKNVL